MKITAIKKQLKNPERVSVFVDDSYSFSLNISQLLEQKLRTGLEIDQDQLDKLKSASQSGKFYDSLLKYITLRPRSLKEIEDYCKRKKIEPEEYDPMIDKLRSLGYIDNIKFANSWVESRRLNKPISQKRLRLELSQKGISSEIINKAISGYDEDIALTAVIEKKRRLSRFKDDQKLTQYLLRQGFDYHSIRKALEV